MPKATAPLCPLVPPPLTKAKTLNPPNTPATFNGLTTRSRSAGKEKYEDKGVLLMIIVLGVIERGLSDADEDLVEGEEGVVGEGGIEE